MFRRSTEPYRRALTFANREANDWNHAYLGCEHLFMGLLRTTDSVAASALNTLNINEAKARAVLAELLCAGSETGRGRRLPRTHRAKVAIKTYAVEEAKKLRHRCVGTEHLLLALVRDGENMAVKLLECLGSNPDQVRNAVLSHVSPGN
jgi:ATP-dependent Clp protease ATP-binding subunit ClpC